MKTPKKPTPEQRTAATKLYLEMRGQVKQAGRLALKLLANPDTTPEMLLEIRGSYVRICADFVAVGKSLREAVPPRYSAGFLRDPWAENLHSEMLP